MNEKQFADFLAIRDGYKTDPRWVACAATLEDPSSSDDECAWARQEMARLERSSERSANHHRLIGL